MEHNVKTKLRSFGKDDSMVILNLSLSRLLTFILMIQKNLYGKINILVLKQKVRFRLR